jgi:hypothetical protein
VKLAPILIRLFVAVVFLTIVLGFIVQQRLITLPPAYDPFTPPDLRAASSFFRSFKLKILDQDPRACLISLHQAGAVSILMPDSEHGPSCYLEGTVMLDRVSVARLRPEQTRCNMAARLYLWERHVVQPLARKYFGQTVEEITHFGSYNCRTIHGSRNMSEHATANAFDISGFRLADGRLIGVLARFKAGGKEGRFLHEARDGLCDYFNLTLSPDYNADHNDHFHVDMGWVRGCH